MENQSVTVKYQHCMYIPKTRGTSVSYFLFVSAFESSLETHWSLRSVRLNSSESSILDDKVYGFI